MARLWHKDFIKVLPDNLLSRLWEDCTAISREWALSGTVEDEYCFKVAWHNAAHFYEYCLLVFAELTNRGADIVLWIDNAGKWYGKGGFSIADGTAPPTFEQIFNLWHDDRYKKQCYYMLEELYDCELIPNEDWNNIQNAYLKLT